MTTSAASYAAHMCRFRPTARDLARDQARSLRGAMLVACALVACVCALFVWAMRADAAPVIHAQGTVSGVVYESIVVQEGDSLWGLSEEHPVYGMTTREVVRLVFERNALATSVIQPGQTLLVPAAPSSVIAA